MSDLKDEIIDYINDSAIFVTKADCSDGHITTHSDAIADTIRVKIAWYSDDYHDLPNDIEEISGIAHDYCYDLDATIDVKWKAELIAINIPKQQLIYSLQE
jgi:hypothetical protein